MKPTRYETRSVITSFRKTPEYRRLGWRFVSNKAHCVITSNLRACCDNFAIIDRDDFTLTSIRSVRIYDELHRAWFARGLLALYHTGLIARRSWGKKGKQISVITFYISVIAQQKEAQPVADTSSCLERIAEQCRGKLRVVKSFAILSLFLFAAKKLRHVRIAWLTHVSRRRNCKCFLGKLLLISLASRWWIPIE